MYKRYKKKIKKKYYFIINKKKMNTPEYKNITKNLSEQYSLLSATNILPGLWIGSIYAATEKKFIEDNNINYVLTVSNDLPKFSESINHLTIPMRDEKDFNIMKYFSKTSQYINEAIFGNENKNVTEPKNNILIHCQLGISRSATVVAAFILQKYLQDQNSFSRLGINYKFDSVSSVVKFLQRKRPTISPNPGFIKQLELWKKLQNKSKWASMDYIRLSTVSLCKDLKYKMIRDNKNTEKEILKQEDVAKKLNL